MSAATYPDWARIGAIIERTLLELESRSLDDKGDRATVGASLLTALYNDWRNETL